MSSISRFFIAGIVACVLFTSGAQANEESSFKLASLGGFSEPFAIEIESSVSSQTCIRFHRKSENPMTSLSLLQGTELIEFKSELQSFTPVSACILKARDVSGVTFKNSCSNSIRVCDQRLARLDWTHPVTIGAETRDGNETRVVNPTLQKLSAKVTEILEPKASSKVWLRLVSLDPQNVVINMKSNVTKSFVAEVQRLWAQCGIDVDVELLAAVDTTQVEFASTWPYLLYAPFSAENLLLLHAISRALPPVVVGAPRVVTVLLGNPLVMDFPNMAKGFAFGHPMILEAIKREYGINVDAFRDYVFASASAVSDEEPLARTVARTLAHEIGHLLISHKHANEPSLMNAEYSRQSEESQVFTRNQCAQARASLLQ